MEIKIENLLPKTPAGPVCAQMVRCGKPNCKCAHGDLHGPYFYHFARPHGGLVKRYVKLEEVKHMRALCNTRRQAGRRLRLQHKLNAHQLHMTIEQLRENEKLLLQFLGGISR